jgi:TRAP transporter 4TM/12TM fusion protein
MKLDTEETSLAQWWASKDLVSKIGSIVAISICLCDVAYVLGGFALLGVNLMVQPYRGLNLGVYAALTFILYPIRRAKGSKMFLVDTILLVMGVVPSAYYLILYDTVLEHLTIAYISTIEVVFFFMLLVSVLEAGRRVAGLPMAIVAAFFVFHAFFSDIFPGILFSRTFPVSRLAANFYLEAEGIFSMPVGVASTIVIMFMLFASVLLFSGGGKFFIDLSLAVLGHVRGGPAKAAIVASGLFGTISGSPAANVMATGSVTIPLMKHIGYQPKFAGAVEAVASNGGQIMPPVMGVVAFVMAEMTGIPYIKICFAALLPAILYYCALFSQVDLEAVRLGLKGLPKEQLPPLKQVVKRGWQYVVPLAALIIFLAVLRYTPERSAFYATILLFFVSMIEKESRMGLYKILRAIEDTGKVMCTVVLACALAGLIISSLNITGVGINLATGIVDLSGGSPLILAGLTAITCFIMGMGMGSIAIYLTLAVLVAPVLVESGVPVVAAHLFILYWGIVSFITPPVCIAAFVAAGIAGSNPMETGLVATRLGIVTYIVPFLFIFSPVLVMIGSPAEIILATITSLTGVLILSVGVVGHFYVGTAKLGILERLLWVAGALLLIKPGLVTDIVGAVIVLPLLFRQVRFWHLSKKLNEAVNTL